MGAVSTSNFSSASKYETAPMGSHGARCIGVIELGVQKNYFYKPTEDAPEKEFVKKLMIQFELNELMQDGRPFVVSWEGSNTLGKGSNLVGMLETWRGRVFTPEELRRFEYVNLLDKACTVTVVHSKPNAKGGVWASVKTASPLVKGLTIPDRVNDLVDFGIGDIGTPLFTALPNFIKDNIWKSVEGIEYGNKHVQDVPQGERSTESEFSDEDSIPF